MHSTYQLLLSGQVQGVGMRFTVQKKAQQLGLKGIVKNLSNGKVKIIVQGKKAPINTFIRFLEDEGPGVIDHIDKEELESATHYTSFEITF